MTKSMNSADPRRIGQSRTSNSPSHFNIPACEQSLYAIIDVVILIAVIAACGFLFYPYARILGHKTVELVEEVVDVMSEEIVRAPMVFVCLGLGIIFTSMAIVAILLWTDRRCGRPRCQGLRAAAEFDMQLETEENVNKSTCLEKTVSKKGLFWFSEQGVGVLLAEWKFQGRESVERLKSSVKFIDYFISTGGYSITETSYSDGYIPFMGYFSLNKIWISVSSWNKYLNGIH